MRIAAAQLRSYPGQLSQNLQRHGYFIQRAAEAGVNLIVFPELSLTGYEPSLAKKLAHTTDSSLFDELEALAQASQSTVCIGAPIVGETLPRIGMVILTLPGQRQLYCKRYLHQDEQPHFASGQENKLLSLADLRLAPAICYESMLDEHAQQAAQNQAQIYLASVAKHQRGVTGAQTHYAKISARHQMMVLMANAVGPCEEFVCAGGSAFWSRQGECLGRLDENQEGLLIADVSSMEVKQIRLG